MAPDTRNSTRRIDDVSLVYFYNFLTSVDGSKPFPLYIISGKQYNADLGTNSVDFVELIEP